MKKDDSTLTLNTHYTGNKDDIMEVDSNISVNIKKEIPNALKDEINTKTTFCCNILLQNLIEGAASVLR